MRYVAFTLLPLHSLFPPPFPLLLSPSFLSPSPTWWRGVPPPPPTQHQFDGVATVAQHSCCFHILQPPQRMAIHSHNPIPHVNPSISGSCSSWIQRGDIDATHLLCVYVCVVCTCGVEGRERGQEGREGMRRERGDEGKRGDEGERGNERGEWGQGEREGTRGQR